MIHGTFLLIIRKIINEKCEMPVLKTGNFNPTFKESNFSPFIFYIELQCVHNDKQIWAENHILEMKILCFFLYFVM